MALPFLALGSAGLKAFQGSKLQAVQSGTKTIKRPKTLFGKAFGKISGRTQAFDLQEQIKNEQLIQTKESMNRNPIGGSVQFGSQTKQANLPTIAIIAATVLGIVFFIFGGKKKGRR